MMMHIVDQALKAALSKHYGQAVTPQALHAVKRDLIEILAGQGITLSPRQARFVRVEWNTQDGSVHLRFPPELLSPTVH